METLSILIADENEEFRNNLSRALQGSYRIVCCSSGEDALEIIRKDSPDILLLDLLLPGLDGISLLHAAVESGICPMVLATSPLINNYITQTAEQLGIAYLLRKPCNIGATIARIQDLSQRIHRSDAFAPDPRTQVSNMLISLGINTKHRGYAYLREAILLRSDDQMQSITKVLYPKVASLCSSEPLHVERSIRTSITSAWEKRDDRIWSQYFQPDTNGEIPRPSNAVFIAQLADRLQLNQMQLSLPG